MTSTTPAAGRTDQAQPAGRRRSAPRAWLEAARRRGNVGPPECYPPAPEGETLCAIGDVHSRADCLARALARINWDCRAEGPRSEDFAERLPEDHRRFLASLGAFHRAGGCGFVHAGLRLRSGVALENQDIDDFTGIRAEFLGHEGDFSFIVVHGHTPVERIDFRSNRINLDTGAYVSNRLSVLRIDSTGAALLAPEAS